MGTEKQLKPCPFCGSMPEIIMCDLVAFDNLQFGVTWMVTCRACHTKKVTTAKYRLAFDETAHLLRDGKMAVIEVWNRRSEDGK